MTRIHRVAMAVLVAATLASPAVAQQAVTQADIQRLQDSVFQADRDITTLRSRDVTRANQLTDELDELRDEVVYLKVKLRKERFLARTEYADVRDRIEDVRTRARGDATGRYSPPPVSSTSPRGTTSGTSGRTASESGRRLPAGFVEIPSGTEIEVRLQHNLNSGTAQVEDRFEATTLADLTTGGAVAIPAGSLMRGVVTGVEPATRTNRTARLTVSFDQVTINGRAYAMRGTVTQAIEGEGIKGEIGRTGAGAIGGAILGGILGGVKGAVLGTIIGGGGTIAATEGKEVELPQGSVLRVRFDSPLEVQTSRNFDR
jgi:TolA-binding protein